MKLDRFVNSWKSLAFCYYELKMQDKAISTLEMVLAVHPDDDEARSLLLKLYGK